MKPFLREEKSAWTLADYPEGTAYEAGYLTQKNAGWRSERPKIDGAKCVGCLQCYLYCPDGVIFAAEDRKKVDIDYDFCKGCGICVKICGFGAIVMEAEREETAK